MLPGCILMTHEYMTLEALDKQGKIKNPYTYMYVHLRFIYLMYLST